MCAPLPCESITCLVFTRLLLPVDLSGIAVCSAACLTFCGVGESLSLYSLHLVSSLGLGIAWMWAFASFNSAPISFHPWFVG